MLFLNKRQHSPNPGPINPCSVCSCQVTWGNRLVQCANCSLVVQLSCWGLSLLIFEKFLQDTLGFVQCAHLPLKVLSSLLKLSPSSSNTRKTQKSLSSKMNPSKHLSTINNPPDLLNHPQLTLLTHAQRHFYLFLNPNPPLFLSHNFFPSFFSPPKHPANPSMECQWNSPPPY